MPSTLSKASGSVERAVATTDIDRRCGDTNHTPLMVASVIGSSRVVKDLLRQGASVSVADSDGYTALHHSVYHRHLAVSISLIEAGADLEARPGGTDTPLHVAVAKGFCQGMVVLMDAGAKVDSRLEDGATPLYVATQKGKLGAVRVLLRANANPLLSAYGSLPLGTAVYNGHLKVVSELVHWYGTDRCTNDGGVLALATAASRKHVDIVTFLCDAGVVDTEGVALCAAIEGCSEACVYLLLRRQGGNINVSTRAYVNMAHGTLPETYDDFVFQETPLVSTFNLGSFHAPRFARLLLEAGADATSGVRFPCDSDEGEEDEDFIGTPLELATSYFRRFSPMRVHREMVRGLKGVIRLLRQEEAVHAVSWTWPIDTGRSVERASRKKSTSIARMLPLLKRRAAKPRVLLAAMSRYNNKHDGAFLGYNNKHDGAFLGYLPGKNAGANTRVEPREEFRTAECSAFF
ncbi:unnamed protein product [Ectocarpus sp. CCAP 1310/34]|nr:unnamed protein product [Ectocarpus sp. CCAP 1310/34]